MKTLYTMLLKNFFPIFLIALVFFILTLEMVDLFANLVRYINNNAAVSQILLVSLYYIPKSAGFALPPALMFSISFSLGNLYSRNELISILGAGISFRKLIIPLLALGVLFSIGYFYFYEHIVIDSFRAKNQLSQNLLGQKTSYSNTNISVLGTDNINVYHADYYNDSAKTLSGLTVVKRDENGRFISRMECEWAEFDAARGWILHNVSLYVKNDSSSEEMKYLPEITHSFFQQYTDSSITIRPIHFQRQTKNIDELKHGEAKEWIQTLRKSGRAGYRGALTDYYKRFSFALTPFIVIFISVSLGSRFNRNILLMSLLISLVISVLYYVSDMILGLFAKQGIIEPASGAWGAIIIFTALGAMLLYKAKT